MIVASFWRCRLSKVGEVMRLRSLLCGVVLAGMAGEACAADLSDTFLRGSQTVISAPGAARWDGFYVGGQVGATTSGADFSAATKSLIVSSLASSKFVDTANVQNYTFLGKADTSAASFGGFVG